jgi:oligopeptide transport system ATP-binding protein
MAERLIEVSGLTTEFPTREGLLRTVDGVDLHLDRGETLGIVGESGSGKSMTVLSMMRLVPPPGRVIAGEVLYRGRDLAQVSEPEMEDVRGAEMAMIFQDPMTSLNPVFRTSWQVSEPLRLHRGMTMRDSLRGAIEMLKKVGMPEPEKRTRSYPHEFSGGMRQRAMIAMGLTTAPSLLIADEPTTALDVTIQAQILELLKEIGREFGTAIILITHNLGVVAGMCDRVMVMYAGRVVEEGATEDLFAHPQHPYTWSLLRSIPRVDAPRSEPLRPIEGVPPDLAALPSGCAFHPRCPFRVQRCVDERPALLPVGGTQRAACWVTQAGTDLSRAAAENGRGGARGG